MLKSLICLVLTGAVVLTGVPMGARAQEREVEKKLQTLFACGDTMIARRMHYPLHKRGVEWIFGDLSSIIREADVSFTNLECVVATCGTLAEKGEAASYLFRARPEQLDILTEVGFDIVSCANNHSLDYGLEAMAEQQKLLAAVGIASAGYGANQEAAAEPVFVRSGDVTLAFIAYDDTQSSYGASDDGPGTFHTRSGLPIPKLLLNAVAAARRHADLVVVSPHWGNNWTVCPDQNRIRLAHALIDSGVDVILGHSAHQLHGVEIYKGKPIIYDMGNFLFDKTRYVQGQASAGFLLSFDQRGFHRLRIHPLMNRDRRVLLVKGDQAAAVRERMRILSLQLAGTKFRREGEAIVTDLKPEKRKPAQRTAPVQVHVAGTTRRLPDKLRQSKPDVELDQVPDWIDTSYTGDAGHGVTVLGARHPRTVPRGCGFVSEVAIEVKGPLAGEWEGVLEFRRRGDGKVLQWRHPIADGAWCLNRTEPGKMVLDRTFVRTMLRPGTYDLYWGLAEWSPKPMLVQKMSVPSRETALVPVGSMQVRSLRITDILGRENVHIAITTRRLGLLAAGGVAMFCIGAAMVLLLGWWRRRRSGRSVTA